MGISKLEEFWLWDLDLRTQATELVWGTFSLSRSLSLSLSRRLLGIMLNHIQGWLRE